MLIWLKLLRGIYNAVAGSGSPTHVWFACVLGMLAAFVPLGWTEPFTWVVVALVLATRAGIGLFLTAFALVKLPMLAGGWRLVDALGVQALERASGLQPFWIWLLNLPALALLGLDRYAAIGGVLAATLLGAATFVPIRRGVIWFREHWVERLNQYRVVRWWRGFWFVRVLGLATKE